MSVALPWGFVTPARGCVVVHHLLLRCCEERRWECSTCLLCTMSSQSSYAHTDFAAFPDSRSWPFTMLSICPRVGSNWARSSISSCKASSSLLGYSCKTLLPIHISGLTLTIHGPFGYEYSACFIQGSCHLLVNILVQFIPSWEYSYPSLN